MSTRSPSEGAPRPNFWWNRSPTTSSALIRTCAVPELDGCAAPSQRTLHRRRDEAIIRLMFERAIRSGEVADLQVDNVDLISRLITTRRGKGGRGRVIPIGQATTEALLRYLAEREQHSRAALPARPRRTQPRTAPSRHPRRRRRLPAPPSPAHRSAPLARRWRLGVGLDSHRRLGPQRHARPLHARPRLREGRRRGQMAQPWTHLTKVHRRSTPTLADSLVSGAPSVPASRWRRGRPKSRQQQRVERVRDPVPR